MSNRFQLLFLATILIIGCKPDSQPTIVPEETDYSACLVPASNTSLEIMTWNLEHFPLTGSTIPEVKNIVSSLDPDIIALQEIVSQDNFDKLLSALDGWEGSIAITGNLNLAFLYKPSEINIIENVTQIYTDDSYAFPRPPAIIKIEHGLTQMYLMDVHLKCCDGADNVARRKEAAALIKTYIDENLPTERVVVLGDYNDEIYSADGTEDTYNNFIDDSDNYRFEDMDIAMGSESNWSYPEWPSHIDHILITNEFFNDNISIEVLKLNECYSSYLNRVSDHRPVFMKIE